MPRAPTPPSFVEKIELSERSVLVVVDDEGQVCDYWSKRLKERFEGISLAEENRPRLILIRSPEEMVGHAEALRAGTLFLVDYQFADGETVTGVDLIERLGLQKRAILVTNHFELSDVKEAVERLGIKLLPKTYMFSVKFPINLGGRA